MEDGYDIAVVKLNKEANHTLPSIDTQGGEFPSGKFFTSLGWGEDKTGEYPNALQIAETLVYVSHHQCKDFLSDVIQKHMICAGFSNESVCRGIILVNTTFLPRFLCEGDSGNPLLIPNQFGGSIATGNAKLDLFVGVTSMGPSNCTEPTPSVFTGIGAFWDWIQETIGEKPKVNNVPHLIPRV